MKQFTVICKQCGSQNVEFIADIDFSVLVACKDCENSESNEYEDGEEEN